MRVFRLVLPVIVLVIVLGMAAALSWSTHHPHHPWLERARSWPLVGVAAGWVQDTYGLPQTRSESAAADEGMAATAAELAETAPDMSRHDARPSTWVRPEMKLLRAPREHAALVATFDVYANLQQLEERDGWIRVRWHDREGWIAPRPGEGPLLGREPDPPRPLMPRPADPERLRVARDLLGGRSAETNAADHRTLGPYALLTDTTNMLLLDRLGRMAPELDRIYAQRFGRRALDTPRETVVFFEHEDDYRALQGLSESLTGLNAAGHAGWGLVAFYRGDRDMDDLAATFVHEITHLINRRAIGPALPPWLDEGLAEALASAQLLPWGGIEPRSWGGHRRQIGRRTEISGQRAARREAQEWIRTDRLPALKSLLSLDLDTFQYATEDTALHYTIVGTLVRYLLDGEDGRWTTGFHGFLDDVAHGGEPSGTALLARLGTEWETFETGYCDWMLSFDW